MGYGDVGPNVAKGHQPSAGTGKVAPFLVYDKVNTPEVGIDGPVYEAVSPDGFCPVEWR